MSHPSHGLLTGIVVVDCLLDLLFITNNTFSAGVVLIIQSGVFLVDFVFCKVNAIGGTIEFLFVSLCYYLVGFKSRHLSMTERVSGLPDPVWLVLAVDILSTCQMSGLMFVPWIK